MTDRKGLTQKQKLGLLLRQDGKCAACGQRLVAGLTDFDHLQDLQHGGDNEIDNWQALCRKPCHASKTKSGVQARSKADRIAAGGKTRTGRPMACGRGSPFKRTFSGKVVRRD